MATTPVFQEAHIMQAIGRKEEMTYYRKCFSCETFRDLFLRIAADNVFAVYLNGTHVCTRKVLSYDFHKFYDEIDLSAFAVTGENILAIETNGSLIAEVMSDGKALCVSGDSFLCMEDLAFKNDTLGCLTCSTLGREEWFDARFMEIAWTKPDYDDSKWEHAEAWTVEEGKWRDFTKYRGDIPMSTPIYAKSVTACLQSLPYAGQRLCLHPASNGKFFQNVDEEYQVYITQAICEQDTYMQIRDINRRPMITLDGRKVQVGERVELNAGKHILCMSVIGECEVLIDFPGGSLTGEAFCGQPCMFAGIGFAGRSLKYPWHETANDIKERISELEPIHACRDAEELKEKFAFLPVYPHGESVLGSILLREYLMPRNGKYPLGLFGDNPLKQVDVLTHIQGGKYLLKEKGGICRIENNDEYDTVVILDLGQETCAHIHFDVEADAGMTMDFHFFEFYDADGISFMSGNNNGFRYITREGRQEYRSMSRYGFRYLMLIVRGKGTMKVFDIHADEVVYPVDRQGSFRCNDNLLNQIYQMCVNTASDCMLDTYVDCPGHEQSMWIGDAAITSQINLLNFGAYDFDQHNLSLIAQSMTDAFVKQYCPEDERYLQRKVLTVGAVSHYYAYPEGGLPLWTFLWVQQIGRHSLYSDDRKDLEENYGYLKECLERADRLINSRGLFDMPGAWNLIEWANNDLSVYGEVTSCNVMLVSAYEIAAFMARRLGFDEESNSYLRKAEILKDNINRYCWDEKRQAYVDTVRDDYGYQAYLSFCQKSGIQLMSREQYGACSRISVQSNTLALLYHCVPEERKQSVLDVVKLVKEGHFKAGAPSGRTVGAPKEGETYKDVVMVGSPFFLYFWLIALSDLHMADETLQTVRNIWGDMLEKGINTCWETLQYNPRNYTRSICHAWSAGPAVLFAEGVLGIRPVQPGFREFVIDPQLGDLHWALGSVVTPYGLIEVKIEKQADGRTDIQYKAPKECRLVQKKA